MQDYLTAYLNEDGFDLPRLLNDDYLDAIKLCWNNRRYVSAAKLIVSFIDTLGFLEFDDTPRNFQRWLETYADLANIGITPDELWEFRNSLLHMTNLDSRRVASGAVRRLTFYVGHVPPDFLTEMPHTKHFGLWQLLDEVFESAGRFCESFNADRDKFEPFITRYDRVVSDVRYLKLDWLPESKLDP